MHLFTCLLVQSIILSFVEIFPFSLSYFDVLSLTCTDTSALLENTTVAATLERLTAKEKLQQV